MLAPDEILNNRYRLDRQIGRGGFARVFLATDLRLGRQVAVKVLDPAQSGDGDFLRRFADEGRALATLDHPHILAIHDSGEADGTAYLVMPYVAGGTLADRIRERGKAAPAEIAAWLRQAAAALDHAHARGLIHRDVKPQNLLMRDDDNLLLADFGVAKALSVGGVPGTTRAIGTIAYMAPEQFDGRVYPASDIYALGCVLCELLSGAPPFPGSTQQILRGHILIAPPRLTERGVSDLPSGVQAVVDRALAKEPTERFPSASAFAEAFAAALAQPTQATGATPALPHEHPTVAISLAAMTRPMPPPSLARPSTPAARWVLPLAVSLVALLVLVGSLLGASRLALGSVTPTTTTTALALTSTEPQATAPIVEPAPTIAAVAPSPTATRQPTVAPIATTNVAPTQTRAAELAILATLAAPTATAIPTPTMPPAPPTAVPPTTTNPPPAAPTPTTAPQPAAAPAGTNFRGVAAATLSGHSEYVVSVAWSPDGRTLASGGYDNTVRLWSADGAPLATLRGHTDAVGGVDWSPDGGTLASGAADNDIRLWTPGGQTRAILRGHGSSVFCLDWSPDGRTLASGSGKIGPVDNEDYTVRLWGSDGRALATLRGHTSSVMAVAWSPNGRTLASVSVDQTVRLWSATGQPLATLTGHTDRVIGVAWSPDGRTLATASGDKTIRLWSAEGRPLATLTGHAQNVNAVAWSPDGTILASASLDRTIRLWSADGRPLRTLTGHTDSVRSLTWSPDGRILASASLDNTIQLWR